MSASSVLLPSLQIDRLVAEMEASSDNGLSSLTEVLDEEMKVHNYNRATL